MAEKLPPLTADEIRKPLNDPTFTVYLYIGEESDDGWDNAVLAFGLLPRLRIYLVENISLIPEWVEDESTKGVVFGYDDKPVRFLNQTEAEDAKIVLRAIYEGGLK